MTSREIALVMVLASILVWICVYLLVRWAV